MNLRWQTGVMLLFVVGAAGCRGGPVSYDRASQRVAQALGNRYGIGVERCELARDRAALDKAAAFAFGRYYCVLATSRTYEVTGLASTEWCAIVTANDSDDVPTEAVLQFPANLTQPPSC